MREVRMCDYCNFASAIDVVREHENNCNYSPKNKTCLSCKHYTNKINNSYELNMFMCAKTGRTLCENNRQQIVQLCDNYENGEPDVKMPKLN